MSLDFTFLYGDQIWGDDNGNVQLEVMKRYGTKVAPTDLTVILGGYMTWDDDRTSENDLTCASWSASSLGDVDVRCVGRKGGGGWSGANARVTSARPALPPSEVSKISPSEAMAGVNGVQIAEYGEYPQTVADDETHERLERLYNSKSLHTTGKNYTFDSVGLCNYDTSFQATSYSEYEMDGRRYIRVPGRPANSDSKLSTGEQVEEGEPYWVEVQPIEWLVDKSGWMVSKKCLFAGIQFDTKAYYDDFSKTFMKHYLDTYFAKEMEPFENTADKERAATLKGLKARLAEVSDLDKVRATIKPARTPERTEELAEIMRLRRAGEFLRPIFKKAEMERDEETLNAVIDMAKPFEKPWVEMRQRVADRRMARHTKKDRE